MVAVVAMAAAAADEPSIPTTRMRRAAAWKLLLLLVPWLVRIMRRAEHLPPPWAVGEDLDVVDRVAEEEREEEEEGVEDS